MSKNILARIRDWDWNFTEPRQQQSNVSMPQARVSDGVGHYRMVGGITFTGEKNIGELGPQKDYVIGYAALRSRSWQMLLESEIVQTVVKKYCTWVVGVGLKLQSEPVVDVIEDEGGKVDPQTYSKKIEKRWELYANSKYASQDGQHTLNQIAKEGFKNIIVGGDVLVILRVRDNCVKVQIVDGDNVISPMWGTESFPQVLDDGNKIINGVEVNKRGEHVAYWVRKDTDNGLSYETERIPAKGRRSGLKMAYMVYGDKYRIDNHRGMPLLAVIFETAKKLERYKEATIASAEERAKIAIAIEHEAASTGENPFSDQVARARNVGEDNEMPEDDEGIQLQNRVIATTNKQVVNLPIGAKLNAMESKNELYFKDFYGVLTDITSSSVEMPPNVAMSKYDQNFSASRAALKDWENTLRVRRFEVGMDFYQPIFEAFLELQILLNKVSAPGYIQARVEGNWMLLEAYRKTRYVGTPVPHIDPVKEVAAERAKLGIAADHIPLTTVEAATEAIGGGDSESNIEQFEDEVDSAKKFKPEVPPAKPPAKAV